MASLPALAPEATPTAAEDRRSAPRSDLSLGLTLRAAGSEAVIPAAIANLSARGFLAEIPAGITPPKVLHVDLPHAGRRTAQVVWTNGRMLGCSFAAPLSRADMSAARLKSEPLPVAVDLADVAWNTASEAGPEEKWPRPARAAVILGAGALPWLAIGGLAALLF